MTSTVDESVDKCGRYLDTPALSYYLRKSWRGTKIFVLSEAVLVLVIESSLPPNFACSDYDYEHVHEHELGCGHRPALGLPKGPLRGRGLLPMNRQFQYRHARSPLAGIQGTGGE
jgi:hypothetical protein